MSTRQSGLTFFFLIVLSVQAQFTYSQDTWMNFYEKGRIHMLNKEFSEAIDPLTKAINLNSDNSLIYSLRCRAFKELGDLYSAMKDCSKAIEIHKQAYERNPSRYAGFLAEFYSSRASLKSKLNDRRGAIEDYSKAIQVSNDIENDKEIPMAKYYYYRGMERLLLNRVDQGCLDLSKAGELGERGA